MNSAERYQIASMRDRPDLVPLVANWLWTEFGRPNGRTLETSLKAVAETVTAETMPRTFALLVNGVPVGTASLTIDDLDSRPDLTPWLAGVVVAPEARGKGLAAYLVAAVEAEAIRQSVTTLWLYTWTAERIYQRIGWRTIETFERKGLPHALMRRDLTP
jgi:GNAT superfamily N-acetyltransferase